MRYALQRSGTLRSLEGSIVSSAKFVGAQVLDMTGLLIVAGVAYGPRSIGRWKLDFTDLDRSLVATLALGPLAACAGLALFVGFNSLWGAPMLSFVGLFMVISGPGVMNPARFWRAWIVIAGSMPLLFIAIVLGWAHVSHRGLRTDFPGRELAAAVQQGWRARVGRPLALVYGETWLAGNVVAYATDRPQALIANDYVTDVSPVKINPWVTEEKLACSAVLLWEGGSGLPPSMAALFPDADLQAPLRFTWHSPAKLPPVLIHWAIAPPDARRCRRP